MHKLTPPSLSNNQLSHSERIISLDVLKCFAIFLVCWAHGIQHLTTADCVENPLYRWIYSFHMPLFMMVSGYFSVKSMKSSFWPFVGKKLKQIALPGFMWPWIYMLIGVAAWGGSIHLLNKNFTEYIPFWFLWSLLICNLLAYIGGKFKYGRIVTLVISQGIQFANVIYMYPAFVLGQIVAENKDIVKSNLKKILLISALVYFVSLLFWSANDWHLFSQVQERISSDGYVSAGLFYVGKTVYKLLVNLSGALFFFSLFTMAEPIWKNGVVRFLGFIGKYTLIIYILQSFIIEMQLPKYLNLDCLSWPNFNLVVTPAISIGVVLFSVAVAALVDKNRYTRLLLLGR